MNMKLVSAKWVTGILVMVASGICHAYEVVEVTDGGTISGKVTFNGSPPTNPAISITTDKEFCGDSIAADYMIVSGDGGLKNAVVTIENIDKGKAYDKAGIVEFVNTKCMFEPHVSVAVKGQKLGIVSRDPILHNTHLYHGKKERTLYNIAIPLMDKVIKKPLKKTGKVTVKCDAHEWMLGYVYVVDHPYATVSAEDGSFTLEGVPAGDYNVKIWHEKLGEATQAVSVPASGAATMNHSFSQ